MSVNPKISEALEILKALGLPSAQQNERSALCLLALCDMQPDRTWERASQPLLGITPMMEWFKIYYQKEYAPNSRETVRRFTMHQFVDAGIALYNPDLPSRPVNSPKAVYQIATEALALIRLYGTKRWEKALCSFLQQRETLAQRYAQERAMVQIPICLTDGQYIHLSPGAHSELIRDIVEEFAPRFALGSILAYAGDTGDKWGYFDRDLLASLRVTVDSHGKMPDVILYSTAKNWLLLVEAVTSHGPVDGKRHAELAALFSGASAGLVYVTAFPTRSIMSRYLTEIAWETEVWVAESPTHLIHFNGARFLGPYTD